MLKIDDKANLVYSNLTSLSDNVYVNQKYKDNSGSYKKLNGS